MKDGRRAAKEKRKRQKRLRKLFEAVCSGQRSRVLYRLFRGGVNVCGCAIEAGTRKKGEHESDDMAWDSATVHNGTPLHIACAMGTFDVAKLLVEHGADVNVRDERGAAPLHVACHRATTLREEARAEAHYADSLSAQAAMGTDVNCDGDDGAETEKLAGQAAALCALLVSHGADAHVPDRWGASAVDLGLNGVLDAYASQQAEDEALKRASLASACAAADAEAWSEKLLQEHELESRSGCDGSDAAFGFGDGWDDTERLSAAMGVRGAPHAKVPPQMGRDADSAGCRGAKRGRNTAGPSPDGDGDGDGDGYRDKKPRAQRPRMAWEHDIPDGGSGRNSGEDKPRPQMRDGAKPHQPQPEEAQCEHSRHAQRDRLQLDDTAWRKFCATAARMKAANVANASAVTAPSAGLRCADIPWPSGPPDNLLNFDLFAPPDDFKRLVRGAWLRWHPDKFVQKFGGILMSGVEHEKIMDRLKEVVQHINNIAAAAANAAATSTVDVDHTSTSSGNQ